jgi:hypothetical protein
MLTPPGEDPAAALRAAGLMLPKDTNEELAGQLGVSAGWGLGATLGLSTEPGSGDRGHGHQFLRFSISLQVIVRGLMVAC